jgi:hypothetical protein
MLDMSAHGAHRKLVAGAYANSSLHRYEPTVDHGIRDVLAALEKQRGDGTVEIDVSRWAYYCNSFSYLILVLSSWLTRYGIQMPTISLEVLHSVAPLASSNKVVTLGSLSLRSYTWFTISAL